MQPAVTPKANAVPDSPSLGGYMILLDISNRDGHPAAADRTCGLAPAPTVMIFSGKPCYPSNAGDDGEQERHRPPSEPQQQAPDT
jgi:hypothetical protein